MEHDTSEGRIFFQIFRAGSFQQIIYSNDLDCGSGGNNPHERIRDLAHSVLGNFVKFLDLFGRDRNGSRINEYARSVILPIQLMSVSKISFRNDAPIR